MELRPWVLVMPTYTSGGAPELPELHILRGRRIEEFSSDELLSLHEQLGNELPDTMEQLTKEDGPKLLELELIEEELERRDE